MTSNNELKDYKWAMISLSALTVLAIAIHSGVHLV